ncbi:SDR family oxidoreductase [Kitasatospora sp. NPDC008050]|uniref:SDR family oxidoreductase n=1 Tax=Kitasatospora sp. NPDC008050 TaxID=3364021 RepID=UPI0036E63663
MTSSILLTGGTGTLGRHVLPLLRAAGREVRVLSRQARQPADGVEYATGDLLAASPEDGIAAAVAGVEIILHLAGGPEGDAEAARNLVRAARLARAARAEGSLGVRHLVFVSVIGADRVPLDWFASKLGAEQAVTDSGLPWTTLRAAQFHDLTLTVVRQMAKLPVMPVPGGLRLQPVDPRDVAARLVDLALGQPAGLVPDFAGPRTYGMADLSRAYLAATGERRTMVPMRTPGKAGRAYRAGENLAREGAHLGTRTWEEFLAERLLSG